MKYDADDVESTSGPFKAAFVQIGTSGAHNVAALCSRNRFLRPAESKAGSRLYFGKDELKMPSAFIRRCKTNQVELGALKAIISIKDGVPVVHKVDGCEFFASVAQGFGIHESCTCEFALDLLLSCTFMRLFVLSLCDRRQHHRHLLNVLKARSSGSSMPILLAILAHPQ
jgi:hypothetical protein